MRRIAVLLVGSFAIAGATAAPAFATFHLEMSNEVMLASSSGDAGVQFVELLDHGGSEEAFTPVFAPYKLVVYDAAGNKLGEHELNPSGLGAAARAGREDPAAAAARDRGCGAGGDGRVAVCAPPGAGHAALRADARPRAVDR